MDIVLNFRDYIPSPHIFISHYHVLERMGFIKGIKIVDKGKGNKPIIQITRYEKNHDLAQSLFD